MAQELMVILKMVLELMAILIEKSEDRLLHCS